MNHLQIDGVPFKVLYDQIPPLNLAVILANWGINSQVTIDEE